MNQGVLPTLKDVELKSASEANVADLKGFGNTPRMRVEHYIKRKLFSRMDVTKLIMLLIIPVDFMTHNVVLGAVSFKDNMSPDLNRR